MVCIPMGRDQNDTAARVTHHGAGVRLSAKAPTETIRRAVVQVLDRPSFRANAAQFATAVAVEHRLRDIVE